MGPEWRGKCNISKMQKQYQLERSIGFNFVPVTISDNLAQQIMGNTDHRVMVMLLTCCWAVTRGNCDHESAYIHISESPRKAGEYPVDTAIQDLNFDIIRHAIPRRLLNAKEGRDRGL
jgi:hypothetical protein